MQKIVPHLWFDKEAQEAAKLYMSVFENSRMIHESTIHDTPSGDADILNIELAGQEFTLLNGGPYFKFTPSISFLIACDTKEEVEKFWKALSPGGQVMMELGSYAFSEWYGWTADKFGLSWQIMLRGKMPVKQKITPTLMYVGAQVGKAEEAVNFYTSLFKDSAIDHVMKYGPGEEPDKEGTARHIGFTLAGQDFAAMDSAYEHKFSFNEAISFIVKCDSQQEIDSFWEKMSADPAAEQCGWLKDKYSVSWQIVPTRMDEMMAQGTPEQMKRVTQAFLKMKKFDLAELEKAYKG